jgi:hypothetical protein
MYPLLLYGGHGDDAIDIWFSLRINSRFLFVMKKILG